MKLSSWRGNNVLITDSLGFAVLELDQKGNLKESDGREPGLTHARVARVPAVERVAEKLGIWVEGSAVEPGECHAGDIHPEIRDRVRKIAEEFVSAEEDPIGKDFTTPTADGNERALG